MSDDFRAAWESAIAVVREKDSEIRDLKAVLDSKRHLTRMLDIALHGEEGAAKQASLCDLIAPARALRILVDDLKAADRDHLSAKNGMEKRLTAEIEVLRSALTRIRAILAADDDGRHVLTVGRAREIASSALSSKDGDRPPHIHDVRLPE